MQLVVPSAVRKAVRAATMTFTISSATVFPFIFFKLFKLTLNSTLSTLNFPKQLPSLGYCFILQIHTALHTRHGLHQTGPVLLRQALVAAEAGKLADMADVGGGVILRRRCPAVDDVPDAAQPVLSGIGAQQAESGTKAPLHTFKLTKALPSGSREGVFSFP